MKPLQQILVIVDPTASDHPEIDKAATLAMQCGASLQLFICATKAMREQPDDPFVLSRDDLQPLLQALAAPWRERGLKVTTQIEDAEVLHEGLLDCVRHTNADLVVKQTHHHSLLQRTVLTNTDWHLIRDCPQPLLLTKTAPWHAAPTVMAALDPDHKHDQPAALDHAIIERALQLSQHLGGSVQVAHAYLPVAITALMSEGMVPLTATITQEMMTQEVDARRQRLRELTQDYEIPESAMKLVMGTAAEGLPRLAREQQADILVLGAIARSGLQRLMIGSTAERVLEHLPCDALIVKLTRRSSERAEPPPR